VIDTIIPEGVFQWILKLSAYDCGAVKYAGNSCSIIFRAGYFQAALLSMYGRCWRALDAPGVLYESLFITWLCHAEMTSFHGSHQAGESGPAMLA